MPLIKATLKSQLQQVLESMPEQGTAPSLWAMAYVSYASSAMSSASSFPVKVMANLGILVGGFTGAFSSESSSDAASAIASSIKAFWQAMSARLSTTANTFAPTAYWPST